MATSNLTVPLKVSLECNGILVQPGDTLIIAVSRDVTHEEANEMLARLREFTGLERIAFVQGAEAMAAYRPDGDES